MFIVTTYIRKMNSQDWESMDLVGPESQHGQISRVTGLILWLVCILGNTGNKSPSQLDWFSDFAVYMKVLITKLIVCRRTGDRFSTYLKMHTTRLAVCQITGPQVKNNNIISGTVAVPPGYDSNCSSLKNCKISM